MKKLLLCILKIILCVFINASIFLISYVALFANDYDWPLVLYLASFIFLMIGIWILFFVKNNLIFKVVYFSMFFLFINAHRFAPSVKQQFDMDFCLDSGICVQGLKFKDGVMNKDYCLSHRWKWNNEKNECNVSFVSR